jgi:hypothetical protein
MAWSAPLTAVANATLTAAQWNASVRDNLNSTAVALATTAGQYFTATGVNALRARGVVSNRIDTAQTTTSLAYTNLTTPGPVVSVNCQMGALIMFAAAVDNTVSNGASSVSVEISGATSRAADSAWRLARDGLASANLLRYGVATWQTVNPGTNTFTMKYIVGSGTGTFSFRELIVMPF